MPDSEKNALVDAVERNSAIVLSLPSAGMLRHHKSRFLQQTAEGLWVESPPEDRALVDELAANGFAVGVSFKTGQRMVTFKANALRREQAFRINADTVIEALLIQAPATVDATQRRHNYRVPVPKDAELRIKIWRIAEHVHLKDRPMASQQLPCEVADISAGGLGVHLVADGSEPIKATHEERLRIQLEYLGEQVLVEGRLRLTVDVRGKSRCRAGVTFKKLESDLEGRRSFAMLTRIVGDLQRDQVRRVRLGYREAV